MNYFNITLIGGEPCSGKSTLVKSIIKLNKIKDYFEYDKILKGYMNDDFIILGLYENNDFPGTDRLSMAVQPVLIKFLESLGSEFNKHIIFEGDRLFKTSMVDYLTNYTHNFRLIILQCSKNTMNDRHIKRNDDQSQSWLKSKKTTVENIRLKYDYHLLVNEDKNFKDNLDYVMNIKNNKLMSVNQQKLF
jgi:tRNA uridine 5-carbamoylmethylation protein Kti12|tara:strand:+ start:3129 stop:3698 length:570 start_codon:yes stop_codon:yes gene_type:complete